MAMNFWEAQRKAKSATTLYLTVFIIFTLIVATLAELAMRVFAGPNYQSELPLIGLGFLAMTFIVAGFNYSNYLQYGGSYVAESLDAEPVDPNTRNPKERQLLNIVEEMAVAAGLPMPAVYILPAHEINAFAAGTSPQNAAIAVTQGTLERLNRDELQGVVAHEFGHIYNGDMKISMRLAAMLMGFLVINYIGIRLLQVSSYGGSRRSENDRKGNGNPLAIAALIFTIAGIITWFFGSILKAMVSRQREYLADACSVQFTRNPDGIANALKKIQASTLSDMPKSGMAYSHLYLNAHTSFWESLFASHPPLEKRIEAIEGQDYLPEEWKQNLPHQ
jgi:heat shock protein HtpX